MNNNIKCTLLVYLKWSSYTENTPLSTPRNRHPVQMVIRMTNDPKYSRGTPRYTKKTQDISGEYPVVYCLLTMIPKHACQPVKVVYTNPSVFFIVTGTRLSVGVRALCMAPIEIKRRMRQQGRRLFTRWANDAPMTYPRPRRHVLLWGYVFIRRHLTMKSVREGRVTTKGKWGVSVL